jgi:phage terminase small subunit
MRQLTDRQERFVQELIKGKSQREAYKLAGYKVDKMKDKIIDEKASRVFANDKVRARYEEIRSKLVKEAEEECIVSAKEVLRELKHIAFDDIKNYLDFKTVKTQVGINNVTGEPILDYKVVVDLKDSSTIDTRSISEVSIGADGQFKFKLYNKESTLEKLAKHLGMFVDKVEISGEVVVFKGDDALED